jgi:hypothetical protein
VFRSETCTSTVQNPTGVLGPGSQLQLRVIFRPLEATSYRVNLAIAFEKAAANGAAQSRRLSLTGAALIGGNTQPQQSPGGGAMPASAAAAAAALAAAAAGENELVSASDEGFLLLTLTGFGYVPQQSKTGLVPDPPLIDPAAPFGLPLSGAQGASTYAQSQVLV